MEAVRRAAETAHLGAGRTPRAVNAVADAFAALERLYALRVPRGVTVALDLETAVDGGYVRTFHWVMRWAGFYVWVYGSASTVFGNPAG